MQIFIPDPSLDLRPIVSGFSSGTGLFPGFFTNRPDAPLQGLGGKVEIRLCCRKNFPSSLRQVDRFCKETAKETCNFVGSVTLAGKKSQCWILPKISQNVGRDELALIAEFQKLPILNFFAIVSAVSRLLWPKSPAALLHQNRPAPRPRRWRRLGEAHCGSRGHTWATKWSE